MEAQRAATDLPRHQSTSHAISSASGGDQNRHAASANAILYGIQQIVESLGSMLPPGTEVILHDLRALPNSIIAVAGNVTGRRAGDPATDYLLEMIAQDRLRTVHGYATRTAEGVRLRSSTMVIRGPADNAVAAVCINTDLSHWTWLEQLTRTMTGAPSQGESAPADAAETATVPAVGAGDITETFARDVEELAQSVLHRAVSASGLPAQQMRKEQKIAAVRELHDRGFFLLRDSVDTAARALGISRFTVYNYLNELQEQSTR